jgi:hypothetical protein
MATRITSRPRRIRRPRAPIARPRPNAVVRTDGDVDATIARLSDRLDAAGIRYRIYRRPADWAYTPFEPHIKFKTPVDVNALIDGAWTSEP